MRTSHKLSSSLSAGLQAILTGLLGACLLLAPAAARAGDFLDTRITFTLGDDNFFKDAGEQVPNSPLFGVGDRDGYELPFDNLNSATTGRENELHLVLYKKIEGLLPGLSTEVAAAVEMNMVELEMDDPSLKRFIGDDSSYIRLLYAIDPGKEGKRYLDLVLFPLSGDRFRVGYLYDLTWGGEDMFPRKTGPTPAFKLGGNHGRIYWWAGMKMVLSETAPRESTDEQGTKVETTNDEMLYSVLAGLGGEPLAGLSLDLSGGYVQVAQNPVKEVLGTMVTASGFSARVAYGRGLKVGLSSDLRLVRNDPEYLQSLSFRPSYDPLGEVSWSLAAEGNLIGQVLANPDRYGATTIQWASAAALDLRLQYRYLRASLTGFYRSLEFSLLDSPSFIPYQTFPEDAIVQPQIFVALSADYHFPRPALTPGLQAGIELPGAVKTELYSRSAGSNAPSTLVGEHTLLVKTTGERVILPEGKERMPVFSMRLTLKWYPSDILTLLAFVLVAYDQNATILTINSDNTSSRVFDEPMHIGAGVTAQARF